MAIIQVEHVTREFKRGGRWGKTATFKRAIDDLTFYVEPGTAVGYIGANGSGKSTTIKMLTGILMPTSGRVRVCGLNPVPQRRRLAKHLGVLFGQRSLLWWDLPLQESFPLLAAMHRQAPAVWKPRYDELIDGLGLADFLTTPVRNLSLGQRMRGELAAALIHSPELIVLDEPTIGLDLLSKDRLRTFLMREQAERGATLLLTTHDMGDVQRLCSRLLILDQGRLVFDGSQDALAHETGARRILTVHAAESVPADLSLPAGAHLDHVIEAQAQITFASNRLTAAALLDAVSRQIDIVDISLAEPDIEDLVKTIYLRQ